MGQRTCSVDGCDRRHCAKGYCETHWYRVRLYGDPFTLRFPQRKRAPEIRVEGAEAFVPLTGGKVAIIDAADVPLVRQFTWGCARRNKAIYAASNEAGYLHRWIMNAPPDREVDHIDGDGLNNRRSNLRLATRAENMRNTGPFSGRFKGVHFDKQTGRWRAQIKHNGRRFSLGRYGTEVEAALAYNSAALQLHGEFAYINDVGRAA